MDGKAVVGLRERRLLDGLTVGRNARFVGTIVGSPLCKIVGETDGIIVKVIVGSSDVIKVVGEFEGVTKGAHVGINAGKSVR